ncbi:hypothetical protein PRK78_004968 [Emydomyces testavorans]|uniref:Uncharacterized protein n=1 Tax=Emydomyces testavorans TaxID=2070801 RepID=A0AAF0DJL6_9EURO|nr:hypothetical protein PRK78_004968 [Emydomyces testavorans]
MARKVETVRNCSMGTPITPDSAGLGLEYLNSQFNPIRIPERLIRKAGQALEVEHTSANIAENEGRLRAPTTIWWADEGVMLKKTVLDEGGHKLLKTAHGGTKVPGQDLMFDGRFCSHGITCCADFDSVFVPRLVLMSHTIYVMNLTLIIVLQN